MTIFPYPEARDLIGAEFKQSGLLGRGSIWRKCGVDVQWVVQIERPPLSYRVGLDIGVELQLESTPRRPSDCAILFGIEQLSFGDDIRVRMALALDSGMEAADRRRELSVAAKALAEYIEQHISYTQVAEAYRDGQFRAAFIHKDARALLEDGTSR